MRRHGDTAYADIMRNYKGRTFGFASRNFYVAFLAAKQVDQNPEQYFPGVVPEQPTEFDEFVLDVYMAVDDLSDALGVSAGQLERYNPALQATVWQATKRVPSGYGLRLPRSLLDAPIATTIASLPTELRYAEQLPDLFHTVARGDTLSEIADTYRTRVSTLVALNALSSSNRIRIGEKIRLPAAGPAPTTTVVAVAPVSEPDVVPDTTITAAVAAVPELEPASAPALLPGQDETPVLEAAVAELLPGEVEDITPIAFAEGLEPLQPATLQTALLSDPSDYSVGDDGTIEVQPLETLGHYADWLEIRTQRLRDINGLAFRSPVEVGARLRLDLGSVDAATFESRRIAYHQRQQDSFFREHVITGLREHVIRRGESIWILSLREYDVPVWLFRQYNPELDLDEVRPGMTVRFPVMAVAPRP